MSLKQIGFVVFTFAVYTMLTNWMVGLLLVIGVGFHEYSHLFAARKLGLKTKGFYLVPFMGGVAFVDEKYKSFKQQAIVVIAGPAGGGLLAAITAGIYYITQIQFFGQAAVWMCVLNLFNLLPLSFMDGGQLLGTITYSFNRTLGFVCLVVSTGAAMVILFHMNIILFFLVLLFGTAQVSREYSNWSHFREGKSWLCSDEYLNPPKKLTNPQVVIVMAGWLGLSALLVVLTIYLSMDPNNSMKLLFQ